MTEQEFIEVCKELTELLVAGYKGRCVENETKIRCKNDQFPERF